MKVKRLSLGKEVFLCFFLLELFLLVGLQRVRALLEARSGAHAERRLSRENLEQRTTKAKYPITISYVLGLKSEKSKAKDSQEVPQEKQTGLSRQPTFLSE